MQAQCEASAPSLRGRGSITPRGGGQAPAGQQSPSSQRTDGPRGSTARLELWKQPGVPQCSGKWSEAFEECGVPLEASRQGQSQRGPRRSRRAEPGQAPEERDVDPAWGARSKQHLYSQHCSLTPLHGSPSPKTQPGDSSQSLHKLPVPHVTSLLPHKALGWFFPRFWRR